MSAPRRATSAGPPAVDPAILAKQWLNGIRIEQIAHARAAARFHRGGRALGLAATVIAAATGTAALPILKGWPPDAVASLTVLGGFAAAAFASLHTFLDHAGLAVRHRSAADAYGSLRRKFEEQLCAEPTPADLNAVFHGIRVEWDDIQKSAPVLPQAIHDTAVGMVKPQDSHLRPA